MRACSLARPTTNANLIVGFLNDKRRFFAVQANTDNVYVREGLWNKPLRLTSFHGKLSNVQTWQGAFFEVAFSLTFDETQPGEDAQQHPAGT
jgi:hypothetical protein